MNIVFDIGNVLVRWDPRFLFTQYFEDEEKMEWFLAHVCNHEWNLEQDRGRSFAEAVKLAIAQHPDHAEAIAAYDTRWHETLPHAIEGTVAIFKELVGRDAPVYAITNWNGDKFREAKQRFPFLYEFRDIVVSGDERLIKPDPAIYQLLLGRNGLEAADCLFIDDSLKKASYGSHIGKRITSTSAGMSFSNDSSRMANDGFSGVKTYGSHPNCGRCLTNFNQRWTPLPPLGGQ